MSSFNDDPAGFLASHPNIIMLTIPMDGTLEDRLNILKNVASPLSFAEDLTYDETVPAYRFSFKHKNPDSIIADFVYAPFNEQSHNNSVRFIEQHQATQFQLGLGYVGETSAQLPSALSLIFDYLREHRVSFCLFATDRTGAFKFVAEESPNLGLAQSYSKEAIGRFFNDRLVASPST